jgi:hypothetical protein
MSHVIPLDVPDDLYRRLEEMAARRGQSPDGLVLAIVDREVRVADNGHTADGVAVGKYDPQADPLSRFIGMINGPGDLAERHDEYLADEYADAHEDE